MVFVWHEHGLTCQVVDSADPDRIGDSKEELRLMLEAWLATEPRWRCAASAGWLQEEELKGVTLLVLANKQEINQGLRPGVAVPSSGSFMERASEEINRLQEDWADRATCCGSCQGNPSSSAAILTEKKAREDTEEALLRMMEDAKSSDTVAKMRAEIAQETQDTDVRPRLPTFYSRVG
eukprot:Skav209753  [mRNA]  locus=scaffold9:106824:118244:+ [translate_table: standard]